MDFEKIEVFMGSYVSIKEGEEGGGNRIGIQNNTYREMCVCVCVCVCVYVCVHCVSQTNVQPRLCKQAPHLALDSLDVLEADLVVAVALLDIAHDFRGEVELQDAALCTLDLRQLVDA